MKTILGQNVKTFIIRIVLFTLLIGALTIFVEGYLGYSYAHRYVSPAAYCNWTFTVKTWVDTNGNQVLDESEVPLAGVEIFVGKTGTTFTNERGIAVIKIDGSCNHRPDEISIKPPPGYKPTTPARIAIETFPPKEPFRFGFIEE